MQFPNPIGLPQGEGRRVRLRREDDGTFTAQLELQGSYGTSTLTDRTAHQDAAGDVTGDPELAAAFPWFLAQRAAAQRVYLAYQRSVRDVRDLLAPAVLAEVTRLNAGVGQRAESLARQAQEAEAAGRFDKALEHLEELERLGQDYKALFGLEG